MKPQRAKSILLGFLLAMVAASLIMLAMFGQGNGDKSLPSDVPSLSARQLQLQQTIQLEGCKQKDTGFGQWSCGDGNDKFDVQLFGPSTSVFRPYSQKTGKNMWCDIPEEGDPGQALQDAREVLGRITPSQFQTKGEDGQYKAIQLVATDGTPISCNMVS